MLNTRFVLLSTVSTITAASLALAGCSNSEEDSAGNPGATSTAAAASSAAEKDAGASSSASASESGEESPSAAGPIVFEDGVVRAMEEDSDMTSVFGTLRNTSDKDVHVIGFTSSIEAKSYQIHEVVDGVMQEKQDGFDIPAGGEVELDPGGYHFMLMGVSDPILAGESTDVTLLLDGGTTARLGDIPVRSMGAGSESYGDMGDMKDMGDMADMDHADHADHSEHSDHSDN